MKVRKHDSMKTLVTLILVALATAEGLISRATSLHNKRLRPAYALPDIQFLVPALVLSTGLIFAVFNIENKVDITDKGLAEARKKRRMERLARGEDLSGRNKESLDPYRWRVFEDDTDDDNFDLLDSTKKSGGGGCG